MASGFSFLIKKQQQQQQPKLKVERGANICNLFSLLFYLVEKKAEVSTWTCWTWDGRKKCSAVGHLERTASKWAELSCLLSWVKQLAEKGKQELAGGSVQILVQRFSTSVTFKVWELLRIVDGWLGNSGNILTLPRLRNTALESQIIIMAMLSLNRSANSPKQFSFGGILRLPEKGC